MDQMAEWLADWLSSCPVPISDDVVFDFVCDVIYGMGQGETFDEFTYGTALVRVTILRAMRLLDELQAGRRAPEPTR
jgi:hypothetical protein